MIFRISRRGTCVRGGNFPRPHEPGAARCTLRRDVQSRQQRVVQVASHSIPTHEPSRFRPSRRPGSLHPAAAGSGSERPDRRARQPHRRRSPGRNHHRHTGTLCDNGRADLRFPEGIAVVAAIKSVGRFSERVRPEARSASSSERSGAWSGRRCSASSRDSTSWAESCPACDGQRLGGMATPWDRLEGKTATDTRRHPRDRQRPSSPKSRYRPERNEG